MPFFSKNSLIKISQELGIKLDKSRGQCYLIDRNIVNKIFAAAQLDKEKDIVLEIGPGLGTLSDILAENSQQSLHIEFDNKISQYLTQHFSTMNLPAKIIHEDALSEACNPYYDHANKIVSNIPYQISAPLIFKILKHWNYSKVVLMVQKEFADRMMATPEKKKGYSRLSASIGLYLKVNKIKDVSPNCFFPQPRVESTIIELTKKIHEEFNDLIWDVENRKNYIDFLHGIFPYKRKNIKNAIKLSFKAAHGTSDVFPHFKNFQEKQIQPIFSMMTRKVMSFYPIELFKIMYYGLSGKYLGEPL